MLVCADYTKVNATSTEACVRTAFYCIAVIFIVHGGTKPHTCVCVCECVCECDIIRVWREKRTKVRTEKGYTFADWKG